MAELFLPCNISDDQLRLTAELIRTLRASLGINPGIFDESKGGLILPDDLKVKGDAKIQKKAEAERVEAEKRAEAEKAKAEAHAEKLRTEANKKKEPKA